MTDKEAIKILTRITNNNFYGGEIQTACRMGIEALSQPSLPSNLDEAIEEYVPDFSNDFASKAAVEAMRNTFKAGAEWMAGQGLSADFGVCKLADRAWLTPIDEKRFMQDVFDNFTASDKVIVQIRKK